MFILQETPIDPSPARSISPNSANGALVIFEGMVRADKHKTKTVSELLYIADTRACMAEGEKIVQEALSKFDVHEVLCIQRIGPVKVEETAAWIGVWSPHRDEAFKACRYVIEEVKKRLIIWKKEFFTDGTSAWVHGAQITV